MVLSTRIAALLNSPFSNLNSVHSVLPFWNRFILFTFRSSNYAHFIACLAFSGTFSTCMETFLFPLQYFINKWRSREMVKTYDLQWCISINNNNLYFFTFCPAFVLTVFSFSWQQHVKCLLFWNTEVIICALYLGIYLLCWLLVGFAICLKCRLNNFLLSNWGMWVCR